MYGNIYELNVEVACNQIGKNIFAFSNIALVHRAKFIHIRRRKICLFFTCSFQYVCMASISIFVATRKK